MAKELRIFGQKYVVAITLQKFIFIRNCFCFFESQFSALSNDTIICSRPTIRHDALWLSPTACIAIFHSIPLFVFHFLAVDFYYKNPQKICRKKVKMVYGAANELIKFMVFAANLLIFIFGGFLFGFSLWANLDKNFDAHLRDFAQKIRLDERLVDDIARYQASLWILVAVGALLVVVGFLGCCGAACESFLLLTLFSICLTILALIELFVLISLFTNRSELFETLHNAFVKSSETPEGRLNLKPIESLLNCCGATIETKRTYIDQGLCPGQLANAEDCYTVLTAKMDTTALLVCGIALLLIQLFSVLFSSALCTAFRTRMPAYYA